jgi:hypothetical protein
MKKDNLIKSNLVFNKMAIANLNNDQLMAVCGGTSPIVIGAINNVNQALEELREKALQAQQN